MGRRTFTPQPVASGDKIHRLAFDEAIEEGVLDRPYEFVIHPEHGHIAGGPYDHQLFKGDWLHYGRIRDGKLEFERLFQPGE